MASYSEKTSGATRHGESKNLRPRSRGHGNFDTVWQKMSSAQREKNPFPHSSALDTHWMFIHPWERLSAFDLRQAQHQASDG